ncbi:IS110 family transposase, partial [Pseudomonas azotoformans]
MTILNSPTVVGGDVAKAEVVAYREDTQAIQAIANDRNSLHLWLKTLPANSS